MKSFRISNCKIASCRKQFSVCSKCDRGQVYCSDPCRVQGRRESLRRAGSRHQKSPEGARDHADRQAEYFSRWKKKLTHQGSNFQNVSIGLPSPVLVEDVSILCHEADEGSVNGVEESVTNPSTDSSFGDASPTEQQSHVEIRESTVSEQFERCTSDVVCIVCGRSSHGGVRYGPLRRFHRPRDVWVLRRVKITRTKIPLSWAFERGVP